MIYTKAGVPLDKEYWENFKITRAIPKPRKFPLVEVDVNGERMFRTVKDKIGDIIRIYRGVHVHRGRYTGAKLRELRAERGVGRPLRRAYFDYVELKGRPNTLENLLSDLQK